MTQILPLLLKWEKCWILMFGLFWFQNKVNLSDILHVLEISLFFLMWNFLQGHLRRLVNLLQLWTCFLPRKTTWHQRTWQPWICSLYKLPIVLQRRFQLWLIPGWLLCFFNLLLSQLTVTLFSNLLWKTINDQWLHTNS